MCDFYSMLQTVETLRKHLLIIGNGFDLDLGLPTSYNDFLNSSHFKALEKDPNSLAKHLLFKRDKQKWIDVEKELSLFSKLPSTRSSDKFHSQYKEFRLALSSCINDLDYSSINRGSNAAKLITNLYSNKKLTIINFNYSKSVEKILQKPHSYINQIFVHGKAEDNSIVFGVEDTDVVPLN